MKKLRFIVAIIMAIMLIVPMVASAETFRQGQVRSSFNPTRTVTKTAAYTALATDSQIRVTCSTADIVLTLPSISGVTGTGSIRYKILKTDSLAYAVVVTPATGDTIAGEATRKIISPSGYMIISSGPNKNWVVDFETSYTTDNYVAGTVGQTSSVVAPTATTTFTAADCGKTVLIATDALIMNLPPTVAGCVFTFINAGAAGNNIMTINPDDLDLIRGTFTLASTVVVVTGADGVSIVNTKASSQRGDSVTLVGDGKDGWYIRSSTGIWAGGS